MRTLKLSFPLRIGASLAVIPLLVVAGSGTGLAPPATKRAVATVSIVTDPTGAEVFVDGEARGTAPLELDDIAPGAHRFTVVKKGYLDNSRVLELAPDERRAVRVNLTQAGSESRYRIQTEPGDEGEGGGLKWPLILGIAGGGAVAAALLLTGGNEPPTAGSISARPTLGVAGLTTFSFNATASDPNGDLLTFAWDFGDGASGSGQSTTHVYSQTGTFNVTVTVSDGEQSATASTTVSTKDISGDWIGDFLGIGFTMTLQQNGTLVSGSYNDPDGPGTVLGSLSGQREVRLTVDRPRSGLFTFNGVLSTDLDTIAGSVVGLGTLAPFRMIRR